MPCICTQYVLLFKYVNQLFLENKLNTKKFEAEFENLLKQDTGACLQLITGIFVGLTLEYTRHRGFETDKEIVIEGNENQRAITIHAVNI